MKKPTIGEKIASKHLDYPAYPETGKHIDSRKALAAAIDQAIQRAFKDGVRAACYTCGRLVDDWRKADELAAKYGVKL